MEPVRNYNSSRISCRSGSWNVGPVQGAFIARTTGLWYLHDSNSLDSSGAPIDRAMILAAGLGTRFKPWTDRHPKALALVNGKSLLERNIRFLQQFGIDEVLVNVHHFADQILNAIAENNGWSSRITISDESDEVLETGGGLKKAAFYFDSGPFLMMNADILTDINLNEIINF